jgi:Domain of unknown function (DUF4352)
VGAAAGVALIVLAVVGVIVLAGRSSPMKVPKASSPTITSPSGPAATEATTPGSSGTSGSSGTARVSSTITLKDQDDRPMAVTLVKVVDPGTPSSDGDTPASGKRLVGVQLKIVNTGAEAISEAPDNDAKLIDAEGQTYSIDYSEIDGCQSFPGPVDVAAGESTLGCVVFLIPSGADVSKVQFTPSSGFSDSTGQWEIS